MFSALTSATDCFDAAYGVSVDEAVRLDRCAAESAFSTWPDADLLTDDRGCFGRAGFQQGRLRRDGVRRGTA
jgi:hypothetical protein